MLVAIDLGIKRCGVAVYHENNIEGFVVSPEELIERLTTLPSSKTKTLLIEVPQPYGTSPVSIFRVAVMAGMIVYLWHKEVGGDFMLIPRPVVKTLLCGTPRAKDKDVRASVILFMSSYLNYTERDLQKRGVRGDVWQALALIVCKLQWQEVLKENESVKVWTEMMNSLIKGERINNDIS